MDAPAELKLLPDIPCEVDPDITEKELMDSLVSHCKESKEQLIKCNFLISPESYPKINVSPEVMAKIISDTEELRKDCMMTKP